MTRSIRIQSENYFYHVVNRGFEKREIFESIEAKERFIEALKEIHEMYAVRTVAYCVMSNHYHILLYTPEANLSRAVQFLNGTFAQYFNKRMNRDGPVFKGRFKSTIVGDENYLFEAIRYIHNNPVKAGVCSRAADYAWSSYRKYVGVFRGEESNTWFDWQFALPLRSQWVRHHSKPNSAEFESSVQPTVLTSSYKISKEIFERKDERRHQTYYESTKEREMRRERIDLLLDQPSIPLVSKTKLKIWAYRKFLGWPLESLREEFGFASSSYVSRMIGNVSRHILYREYRSAISDGLGFTPKNRVKQKFRAG